MTWEIFNSYIQKVLYSTSIDLSQYEQAVPVQRSTNFNMQFAAYSNVLNMIVGWVKNKYFYSMWHFAHYASPPSHFHLQLDVTLRGHNQGSQPMAYLTQL